MIAATGGGGVGDGPNETTAKKVGASSNILGSAKNPKSKTIGK